MNKNLIVLHCSANDITSLAELTFDEFLNNTCNYWKSIGWKTGGYSVIIWLDGRAAVWKGGLNYEITQDFKSANFEGVTNGASGYNSRAIHICYAGGLLGKNPEDTRTDAQKLKMLEIVNNLKDKYSIKEVKGHRDLYQYKNGQFLKIKVAKACPCFDVEKWLSEHV